LLPRFGVPFSHRPLDLKSLFGTDAPVVLEIGSGMGETTAEIALSTPGRNFLAVEVHAPGVGSLLKQIAVRDIRNLRVIRHDAAEVMRHMIPDASLAGLHLFFPDPWPKKRHHKRRLVQPDFAALAARKLVAGGYVHAATDWPHYAAQIEQVFASSGLFRAAPKEARFRPTTKFERRGLALGHPVRDLLFVRQE